MYAECSSVNQSVVVRVRARFQSVESKVRSVFLIASINDESVESRVVVAYTNAPVLTRVSAPKTTPPSYSHATMVVPVCGGA